MARPTYGIGDMQARERLIASFWSLLEGEAYTQMSVREVCREAGLNKNTFYYHFGSLDELANTYLCLLPLSTYGWWLAANAIPAEDILSGVILFACLAVAFIGIPLGISAQVRSTRFAFTRKGYYERFD